MTSINISVPESMREFVEREVSGGAYGTVSEYVRDLIRREQKRKAQERLEALLLEGLDSPATEWTDKDVERIREEGMRRFEARNQP